MCHSIGVCEPVTLFGCSRYLYWPNVFALFYGWPCRKGRAPFYLLPPGQGLKVNDEKHASAPVWLIIQSDLSRRVFLFSFLPVVALERNKTSKYCINVHRALAKMWPLVLKQRQSTKTLSTNLVEQWWNTEVKQCSWQCQISVNELTVIQKNHLMNAVCKRMLAAEDSNLRRLTLRVGVRKEEYPEKNEQQEANETKRVTDLTTAGMKTDVNIAVLYQIIFPSFHYIVLQSTKPLIPF